MNHFTPRLDMRPARAASLSAMIASVAVVALTAGVFAILERIV